jgi:hypothetical protein
MNKIITNNSVQLSESEVNNLIVTLGPVIEAFTGGGGGQGSVIYTPGDDNISINNTQHTIALSTDAAAKLNTPIPTKVSDLTDSANYATVDAINAKLDKDEFAALSGDFATKQYVQAASAEVTGWVNNQNYLTQVPDTYYLKTETSGKDELSAAFNDILKYNVTAAAGIQVSTATDAGVKTFGISMTAQPVVTDTTLSGYNGIAATRDGEINNQWNIGLTQDQLNTINGKLDSSDFTTYTGTTAPNTYLTKTSADTLYQPTGNYVTTADVLTGTNNTLTGIKIGSTDYTIPTTDLSNYYTKTQVDSTFASASQLNSYLTTVQYQTDSATFALKTQLDDYAPISITATVNTLTAASAGWNNKVDKPTELVNKYLVLRTDSNGAVSGWCDFQDQSYSKSEALGTFVATANIDTTTLSGDGKSVSTKLGVKTDVIATTDYVNSSFLPTSGGTVSGDVIVKSTGKNLLTVNTTATLMGQSRVNSLTDTTAIGTNWLGVNSNGGGFLKNVQGGNVGDLNGTSIQIDFAPNGNTAYGNITVNSQGNMSKVVHVPTASYDSMSSFDNTNGPNYMLRKTASGFDIGACVINVTSLPDNTEANTYYFIYDT